MYIRLRLPVLCLIFLLLITGLSQPAPIHAQTILTKQLIDGEWRSGFEAQQRNTTVVQSSQIRGESTISHLRLDITHWGRLALTSYVDGNAEIYAQRPDGETAAISRLTNSPAADTNPRLNSTGDLIVFVSDGTHDNELYRMDIRGNGRTRLTKNPASDIQPSWSSDSHSIIFASNRSGNMELYRIDADGSNLVQLTNNPGADVMPSYSPDGKTIAWVRAGTTDGTLWLMNSDGSNPRAITGAMRYLQHPSWSPNGSQLAIDYDRNGDGFNELATINTNGSGFKYLPVSSTASEPGQLIDLSMGSWSPSGNWLVTTVYVYNVSGGSVHYFNSYINGAALDSTFSDPVFLFYPYTMYPDLKSIDHVPPRSKMDSLPEWIRGNRTTLHWSSIDETSDRPNLFDIQYRVNTGAWVPWKSGFGENGERQIDYIGAAGTSVDFRIRAYDDAGNYEPWHSVRGDAHTTFFATTAQGTVSDNRGAVPAGAIVHFTPNALAPSPIGPIEGEYTAYLQPSIHTAFPSAAGYTAPPATTLKAAVDHVFNPYLLPNDNKVQNSGFENNLSSWSSGGTPAPVITTTVSLTGGRSAQFGRPCLQACLTPAELVPSGDTGFSPTMHGIAVDASGTAHTIWSKLDYYVSPTVYRLYYQTRSANGTWSQPAHIGDGTALDLLIDEQQTLHTIWLTDNFHLLYSRRPAGGNWTQPITIATATSGHITLDHHGRLYLVYGCSGNLVCTNNEYTGLRVRDTDGKWSPSYPLPNSGISIAFAPGDSAYALWWDGYNGIIATINQQGSLGPESVFSNGYEAYEPKAVVDSKGTIHIVWNLNQDTYYVQIPQGGVPTLPISLPDGGYPFILLENGGTLYMLNPKTSGDVGSYVRAKTIDGPWAQPIKIASQAYSFLATTDISGRLHMLRSGPEQSNGANWYYQTILGVAAGTSTLKQSIAIPANMHKPTLSFKYSLAAVTPGGGSQLLATVNDGVQSTTVFTSTTGAGWSLASIDMQQWAGKTVDIAIELHQAAGAASANAFIDDVALGSWLTPVIRSVTPEHVAHPQVSTVLTIHGENFISAPTVTLGTTALTNIKLVNEQTIQATVPAAFKPGQYVLTVKNPGKQSAQIADIQVGYAVQVPVATR